MLDNAILGSIRAAANDMEAAYRAFHQMPELSMQETRTSAAIVQRLEGMGLSPQRFGGTGVVAVIENGTGPVVAYRADIDALPIKEATGLDYASSARGILPDGSETHVMHGCGHDMHITVGLYLAHVLVHNRASWAGTVIMIFQPGEETGQGAQAMLEDGLWATVTRPEAIYAQHDWPGPVGHLFIKPGTAMAMSDSLKVTVHGRQAHGAQPEDGIDPIVLGAYMIVRLQSVVSREIAGTDMAVITIGTFHGGLKENIIPDRAEFKVNIRSFDEGVREKVLAAVRRIILAEAVASGAPEPDIESMYSFPRCHNDPQLAENLIARLGSEFGPDKVHLDKAHTGSEDFGRFGDQIGVPYVYWHFGVYSPGKFTQADQPAGIHSPFFASDDVPATLHTGVRAALTAVLGHVGKPSQAMGKPS
ncbi:amidohydrolase [Castellaniella sp.]|uniref:amidohydrolase n=1 Tax=Castellaniella sp. TaxID=1955812 RepID=UPI00355D77B1